MSGGEAMAELVGRSLLGQVERLEHVRFGEHHVVRDQAAGDSQDLQRVQPVPATGRWCDK
ncbi:hypothetical protein AB0G05_45025 [Nonomuraea wenchangensis]